MNSRERILTAVRGEEPDHVPLHPWVFGFAPPPHLRWRSDGAEVIHWYTGRLEHLHTLPEPWGLEDDFRRVDAWLSQGLDDLLEVSIPWGCSPRVTFADSLLPAGADGEPHPVMVREYSTPDGPLRHAVRRTGEANPPGWVVQPDHVPLLEDFNIARAVRHLVTGPEQVRALRWLYTAPDAEERQWLADRMARVVPFARDRGVAIQAWSAFGVDAAVWMAGAEGAVMLCLEHREAFEELLDIIFAADRARTALALEHDVDMIACRGWYSSTDFWSPRLFRECFQPRIAELAALTHAHGKLFCYVMTTGVMRLADDLIEAGVDLLYYVDPVQDRVNLAEAARRFRGKLAVAGGLNSGVTLAHGSAAEVGGAVRAALSAFGAKGGFVLSPVDALFPDTPVAGVEAMVHAWRECHRR